MKTDNEYLAAIEKAKANLADLKERGENAIDGGNWKEFRKELYTEKELAEIDFRVSIILQLIRARRERGISQKKLEELSGIKQSAIARLERGNGNPQIDTLQRLLIPLGMTLKVVPVEQ